MLQQLELRASNAVRSVLSDIGRTEDVRFSPDNRRLILAGYGLNHLLILRIAIEASDAGPVVVADDFMELTSDGITSAHGLDFLDDRTLAVANRDGLVSILEIPPGELAGRHSRIDPIRELSGGIFCKLKSPGSLAARRDAGGRISLLVCNNYTHRVTQHVVDPARGYRVRSNRVLMARSLDIPDGIAVSYDERWIAVSNHNTHEVMLFDAAAPLGPGRSRPEFCPTSTILMACASPPDDRHLLVADAGAPLIHVYERGSGWAGERGPIRSVTVLDDETFIRGRANPRRAAQGARHRPLRQSRGDDLRGAAARLLLPCIDDRGAGRGPRGLIAAPRIAQTFSPRKMRASLAASMKARRALRADPSPRKTRRHASIAACLFAEVWSGHSSEQELRGVAHVGHHPIAVDAAGLDDDGPGKPPAAATASHAAMLPEGR